MKQYLFLFAILFLGGLLQAQPPLRVQSTIIDTSIEGVAYVKVSGSISPDAGWHLYAKNDTTTDITIVKEGMVDTAQAITGKKHSIYDPLFAKTMTVYKEAISFIAIVRTDSLPFRLRAKGYAARDDIFLPFDTVIVDRQPTLVSHNAVFPVIDTTRAIVCTTGETVSPGQGWIRIFLLALSVGLLATLTPCVFPMIPITIMFFGKQQEKSRARRNGLFYSACIIGIYLIASIPFWVKKASPQLLNSIATHPLLNLLFFGVFVVFALSFFGLFEISLSSRLGTAADKKSGGRFGIFFMALTLVITSFSCTGPLLGSLLVGSLTSQGGALSLTIGLGGFGIGLALPFFALTMFPFLIEYFRSKSGPWMKRVEHIFAFVELGLALKFLSNVDMVNQWGFIKRERFIGIWIILALSVALYVIIRGRYFLEYVVACIFLAFAVYLTPGLIPKSNAKLDLVNSFLPPRHYSLYQQTTQKTEDSKKFRNDYEAVMEIAKRDRKPILIDFTGWTCLNCRKMEENVWKQTDIQTLLSDRFVIVSLYVDDRGNLARPFSYTDKNGIRRTIATTGEKWAAFQAMYFKQASQPLYAVVSPDGRLMSSPIGYTPNAAVYKAWLLCSLGESSK